jgi:hypothetical protein
MSRLWILTIILWTACVFTCPIQDAFAADSLRTADTVYVIPAGPVAGSFTPAARITVADTVAGWAKIQIEGWVPVGKVADRLNAPPSPFQNVNAIEKPEKKKPEVHQCEAITRKGTRCTRNAIKGSRYCWQHTPK